jgi:hypothetical protein
MRRRTSGHRPSPGRCHGLYVLETSKWEHIAGGVLESSGREAVLVMSD